MSIKIVFRFAAIFIILLLSLPLNAHEYWLQPGKFIFSEGETIQINIKTGQQFKGNSHAYLPDEVETMNLYVGDVTRKITPRFGAYPAIAKSTLGKGLHLFAVTSQPTNLTYTEPGKFKKFTQDEGLDWVLQAHKKRGLPMVGFTESFRRYTKTLVHVENSNGEDKKVGLTFEWVLQPRLAKAENTPLTAKLWWQGKPFANKYFRVFIRAQGKLTETTSITDEAGLATFQFIPNAEYLLNSVHMVLPDKKTLEDSDVVWDSRWASLTFKTN